jgi:NitT/TauT family transport system substrate-binding protein
MPTMQTRRRFLTTLSVAGAAEFVRAPRARAAEGLPETTSVRLARDPGICLAPQYAAEELLRAEGLTDIRYLEAASDSDTAQMIARRRRFHAEFCLAIRCRDRPRSADHGFGRGACRLL